MQSRKQRPVKIGILTAPMPVGSANKADSYLDRNYVSWVEMSGANAVVIPYNTPNLRAFLARVHGVVLVGGAIENTATHDPVQYRTMIAAVRRIFKHAVAENGRGHHFTLWGTCLGFYLLAMMGEHLTTNFFRGDHVQPERKFRQGGLSFVGESRLRAAFPPNFVGRAVATHLHEYGFDLNSPHVRRMQAYLKVASVDTSDRETPFMNMFEYKKYPFYGSQWHPEKPKGAPAVAVSAILSDFLKKECAKNKRAVPLWGKTFQAQHFNSPEAVLVKGGAN